ncbi:MAG TPA: polysaccharide deacetylase family protein [Cyclobacteriaceae bacterium]|nr:polysaccharide deacetylase family protein [Cytophagales bacterium]HRE68723.1 polysaccharide deacetylase family protein [Cyclobacteriaceae bacterium]HRF34886.1 polysaccharide deacetylase family protein [Cyclobacteriaceae bacterium]
MNLFRTPFFLPLLYPQLIWRMPGSEKKVYVTFDDGPVPGPTEFVLNTLNEFKATATFFCIGDNVRKHPYVFSKIVQAGHAVGNHTFHHLKGWNTPLDTYLDDVVQCETELETHLSSKLQITDHQSPITNLFRPPYGRITHSQINELKTKYKIIMWDVLTQDYRHSLAPDKCIRGTIKATRPGSIVVFHDSYKAEKNLMFALPRYLEYLTEEGYTFGRL